MSLVNMVNFIDITSPSHWIVWRNPYPSTITAKPYPRPSSSPSSFPTFHCTYDGYAFLIDANFPYFNAYPNDYDSQLIFLDSLISEVYPEYQPFSYILYDTSYSVVIPFDSSFSKKGILGALECNHFLFDDVQRVNVAHAFRRMIYQLNLRGLLFFVHSFVCVNFCDCFACVLGRSWRWKKECFIMDANELEF